MFCTSKTAKITKGDIACIILTVYFEGGTQV